MTVDEIARVLVKGLEWRQTATNAWDCGHYHINQRWPHNDGPFYVSVSRGPEVGVVRLGQFPTLAAAKAAAEADYRARIAAALNLDLVAQLVEAGRRIQRAYWDETDDIIDAMYAIDDTLAAFREAP